MMPHECIYQYEYFIIVGFIINIVMKFILKEKRINKISENKFSLKINHYTVL